MTEWAIRLTDHASNKIHKGRARILIRGISNLQLKALFISLAVHLVVLNVFIFKFPLSRESFKPSFVFLGSILEQQEMGSLTQPPNPAGLSFSSAKDPSDRGVGNILYSTGKTGYRFIQATDRKPVSSRIFSAQEKIVTKSLFDIAVPEPPVPTSTAASETSYEIAPYKPLGIFSNDPN